MNEKELKYFYRDQIKHLNEIMLLNPVMRFMSEWKEDGCLSCGFKEEPNKSLQYVIKNLESNLEKMEEKGL